MSTSDLHDTQDAAIDSAPSSLGRVSDASKPDGSVPDVLDDVLDDVADLAGTAVEFAGDVAGVVAKQGGRGLARGIRAARRHPKVAVGVLAIVLVAFGLCAVKHRSSEPSLDEIS